MTTIHKTCKTIQVSQSLNRDIVHRKIEKFIGSMGDLKAEANAILLEHDLDVTPYSQNVVEGLPDIDCTVTENDLKDREDWRQECVFTIDPDTAVDLDDAVSCKLLENGNYEVILPAYKIASHGVFLCIQVILMCMYIQM